MLASPAARALFWCEGRGPESGGAQFGSAASLAKQPSDASALAPGKSHQSLPNNAARRLPSLRWCGLRGAAAVGRLSPPAKRVTRATFYFLISTFIQTCNHLITHSAAPKRRLPSDPNAGEIRPLGRHLFGLFLLVRGIPLLPIPASIDRLTNQQGAHARDSTQVLLFQLYALPRDAHARPLQCRKRVRSGLTPPTALRDRGTPESRHG